MQYILIVTSKWKAKLFIVDLWLLRSLVPACRTSLISVVWFTFSRIYTVLTTDPRISCFQTKIFLFPLHSSFVSFLGQDASRCLCGSRNFGWNWPSRDNSSSSGRYKWVIIGNCLWRLRHGNCLCIKQIREKERGKGGIKGRTEKEREVGGGERDYYKARCNIRKTDYHIPDICGINRVDIATDCFLFLVYILLNMSARTWNTFISSYDVCWRLTYMTL